MSASSMQGMTLGRNLALTRAEEARKITYKATIRKEKAQALHGF